MADPQPLTLYQQQYNDQNTNVLDVTDNAWIDAPSVEQWLIENAPGGIDTSEDTIFFINWWGRDDFQFHVYTKTDEPDPDTGYNFGQVRESRKMIAWGGTTAADEESGLGALGTNRVWFYDLSAGPESWTDNWNVDDADLDGNGRVDYRMPPSWEYLTPGGNKPGRQSDEGPRADHALRRDRSAVHDLAAVHAGTHTAAHAELGQPRPQHLRGLDRRRRLRDLHPAGPGGRRGRGTAEDPHDARPPGRRARRASRSRAS